MFFIGVFFTYKCCGAEESDDVFRFLALDYLSHPLLSVSQEAALQGVAAYRD